MKRMTIWSLIGAIILGTLITQEVAAQVSRSAVLFLRIPQGARAIAMGRSYTAVAEDASATFWNPAGLGSAPLADRWESIEVPSQFRPMSEVVSRLDNAGGADDFELWAVGNNRLVRFRNGSWIDREVIYTKTSDAFDQLIVKYVSADDATTRDAIFDRIRQANNRKSFESISTLRDSIKLATSSVAGNESVTKWADSLEILWRECRLNSSASDVLSREFAAMNADGSINESDLKKLGTLLQGCRNNFIPEELIIPFSTLTGNSIKSVAANAQSVMVVCETGLLNYVGNGWRVISGDAGSLLGTDNVIHDIAVTGPNFYLATERGLVTINGSEIDSSATKKGLPAGAVTHIGGTSTTNMFAVVDNDLFRFDGMVWMNTVPFLVPVDASEEKLAQRFSPYRSQADQSIYLAKLKNKQVSSVADSLASTNSATEKFALAPGTVVEVPYLSRLQGKVYDVAEAYSAIFVATEYGLLRRNDNGWTLLGYDSTEFSKPLDSIAMLAGGINGESLDGYRARIMTVNDLTEVSVPDGRMIWYPARLASGPVTRIQRVEGQLLFTTKFGVYSYDGVSFSRANMEGLSADELLTAIPAGRDIWYASRDQAVTSIPGNSDLTLSYVKWLPNLASDLYFIPLSAAINLGTAGTLGINLTGISYGEIERTNEQGVSLGTFNSYDAALTVSYGNSLTSKLKAGISIKLIQSRLSEQGAGAEKGSGDAFGLAFDFGGLYEASERVTFGAAVSNIGPKMSYIDAAQSDPLPANMSVGAALYPWKSNKSHLLVTPEADLQLIGLGLGDMISNATLKAGLEFMYEDLFALRGGFYNDKLGKVTFLTAGVGFRPIRQLGIDIAYVIDNEDQPLAGTFPITLNVRL